MYLLVERHDGTSTVGVRESDNLREFSVRLVAVGTDEAAIAMDSAGAGTLDDEHGWVKLGFLRAHATSADPDWSRKFDQMIAYAASKGWTSDDGTSVRGHLVRS